MAFNNQNEEREIINDIKTGDTNRISELINIYQKKLFGFLYRIYPNIEMTKDLFQETWLRVIKNIHRFHDGANFQTWLYQIALNLTRDQKRREKIFKDKITLIARSNNDWRKEIDKLNNRIDEDRKLDILKNAIFRLPKKQQEVLILRFYEGLSEEETSTILKCPCGTVKSRLYNAIKYLKDYMKEL